MVIKKGTQTKASKEINNSNVPKLQQQGEQEELDELGQVKKQLEQYKIQKKKAIEEHEKEIKKKQKEEHSNSNGGATQPPQSADGLTGVKRSKPAVPVPAFQFYKDENPKRSAGWLQEQWRDMDETEKRPYYDRAEADKKRYKEQMDEYEKIHAKVTHHKVQKKDKKKLAADKDEDGTAAKASSEEDDHEEDGKKKITKKGKKRLAAKVSLSTSPNGSSLSTSPGTKNKVTTSSPHLSLLSASSKALTNQNRQNQNDDEDEDEDDEDDEDEDDEDEDDDEEGGEEIDFGRDEDCFADEDDEGYNELKRGFKHANNSKQQKSSKVRAGKRWNS